MSSPAIPQPEESQPLVPGNTLREPVLNPFAELFANASNIHNPAVRTLAKVASGLGAGLQGAAEAGSPKLVNAETAHAKLPVQLRNTEAKTAGTEAKTGLTKAQTTTEEQKPGEVQATTNLKNAQAGAVGTPKSTYESLSKRAATALDAGDMDTYNATLKEMSQIAGAKGAEGREQQAEQFQKKEAQQASQFDTNEKFKTWQTKFNAENREKIASMTADKAPAQILQTGMYAQGAMRQIADARQGLEQLKKSGVLGNVAQDKIEDWVFGKGLVDPSLSPEDQKAIGKLRAALSYTSSATMRAHTGRSSREIYDDIKKTTGLGQGTEALEGALDQTDSLLQDYVDGASGANINELRTGTVPKAQPHSAGQTLPAPKVGDVVSGYKYIGGDPHQKSSWGEVNNGR